MPLTHIEAQEALRDIQRTSRASATALGYQHASPHLILWGLIWAAGYSLTYTRPQYGAAWPVLVIAGTLASFWLGWRSKPAASKGYDWRYPATALAVFLFIAAVFAVMPPRSVAQLCAFFPILVALFYSLLGIWLRAPRMLAAAIGVAALTLAGFFLLAPYFLLWMAVVGGGALILGGIWLRSV